MKIIDLLNKNGIELNPIIKTKNEAISRLVDLMDGRGILLNKEEYKNEVLKREEISTTGIGEDRKSVV